MLSNSFYALLFDPQLTVVLPAPWEFPFLVFSPATTLTTPSLVPRAEGRWFRSFALPALNPCGFDSLGF